MIDPAIENIHTFQTADTDLTATSTSSPPRCKVGGVSGLVGSALHRHDGVRVTLGDDGVGVELHLALAWGASAPDVGAEVQARVVGYLAQMADVRPHRRRRRRRVHAPAVTRVSGLTGATLEHAPAVCHRCV